MTTIRLPVSVRLKMASHKSNVNQFAHRKGEMCSLAECSPPPLQGFVTVCEMNGELVTAPAADADPAKFTQGVQGMEFLNVHLAPETMFPLATDETAQSAFLPYEGRVATWKKAWYAYCEHGFLGMLEEFASKAGGGSSWTSSVAGASLGFIRWLTSLHGSLYPHLSMSSEEIAALFSPTRDWHESAIRAFAWHPHTNKCAVCWKDNIVRIFTSASDVVPTLKHQYQRSVSCMAWKPLSSSVLAVACQTCILIWHVDPTSLSTRPSPSCAQILKLSGHSPITSLAWDARGRMLASASPSDTAIMVWDVPRETAVPVRRSGGGGVSLLRWAPDNARLFAATPSAVFRVWETHNWTCEKYTKLVGHCQAACWSPDGKMLLFCTDQEPFIYSLSFAPTNSVIGGARAAVKCADLSEVLIEMEDEELRTGGLIQDMAWDPTGERLAVLFQNSTTSSNLIALFNTRLHPVLELIPSGYIRGETGEIPQLVSFQPKFDNGAMLTVCWLSGKVTFIPLLYLASKTLAERRIPAYQFPNGASQRQQELFSLQDQQVED